MAARPFAPGFSTALEKRRRRRLQPLLAPRRPRRRPAGGERRRRHPAAGVTGKLVGHPLLPAESDRPGRRPRRGRPRRKTPAAPTRARSASPSIRAGSGASPITIKGKAFLAGPYNGRAPVAGRGHPGHRRPLRPRHRRGPGGALRRPGNGPHPRRSRTRSPTSSAAPSSSIRSIDVNANKKEFIVNPTSCGQLATDGAILGGGADPTNPRPSAPSPVSAGFQTTDCGKLKFRPKLFTRVFGRRKKAFRAQNPKFRATLIARGGDANLDRTVVTLPKAMILDQSHIKTLCTRPQLAAGACPKSSIYGHAAATSPLLGDKLQRPGLPGARATTSFPTCSSTSAARSTSACAARSNRPKPAASATSSPPPTCRSASSC